MNENEKLPCHRCWNEHGSKDECVEHCQRLENYQYNKPWYHIPPYGMEQKEEVTIPAPIKEEPKDVYVAVKVCLTCRIEVGNRRGLCTKCYDKWRKGGLIHPIEGLWKPNRKTRPKKVKKTHTHGISDEALRNVQPSLNAAVKRIEGRQKESRAITIDFANYDELYDKIKLDAKRSCLPINHVILNFISIGVQMFEMPVKTGIPT